MNRIIKKHKQKSHLAKWLFLICLCIFSLSVTVSLPVLAQNASDGQTIPLSLNAAINMAFKNNIIIKLAHEHIEEIKGVRTQSQADLLPHVSVSASQSRIYWYNLAADGLPESGTMGPFNSFGARLQIVQRVFDLSALSGLKAEEAQLKISEMEEHFTKQQIILSAVFSYLNVLHNQEKLKAVDEDINLAEQLVKMAEHQLAAGLVTELDVVRAKTRLTQQLAYRQDVIQNFDLARFQLMRVTGLPLESKVALTDSLTFFREDCLSSDEAIKTALKDRIEMSIAKKKVQYQDYKLSEAKNQRLPMIDLYGNYGRSGTTWNEYEHDVAAAGIRFNLDLFDGGETLGNIKEQDSLKRREELKRDDVQVQVEEDVRLALQTLNTGRERLQFAQEAFDLAKREVELAQNQYHAGMENNIAVVEAQAVLERAHEAQIMALMQYHLSRANYYSALGKTEAFHLN